MSPCRATTRAPFPPEELAWFAAGMADGHLEQAARLVAGDRPRGRYSRTTSMAALALEHLDCATRWLILVAEAKAA